MRGLICCLVAGATLGASSLVAAQASTSLDWASGSADENGQAVIEAGAGAPGGTPVSTGGGGGGDGGEELVAALRVAVVDGTACVTTVLVPAAESNITPIPPGILPCPPGAATEVITPEGWVISFLEREAPDRPEPQFIPTAGLTGERMYLVTVAPTTWIHEVADTPFGPLTIDGSALVTVDWGDDSPIDVHTVPGTAWPDGEITHVWTSTGTYDITVTYDWDLNWSFPDVGGALDLPVVEVIDAYPVDELQPIIRRP